MAKINQRRHEVIISDLEWQKYAAPMDGVVFIGVLSRGDVVGALGMQNGMYCCVIDGQIEHLNQRKTKFGVDNAKVLP